MQTKFLMAFVTLFIIIPAILVFILQQFSLPQHFSIGLGVLMMACFTVYTVISGCILWRCGR